MTKIIFICHGNICRSPMAEFILKDLVKKAGREREFKIASAAVSAEELGNRVYPPARRLLEKHGIDCSGKTAVQIRCENYDDWDMVIYMDESNRLRLLRIFGGDPDGKLFNLLDFAGRTGEEIDDPWYTGDFRRAWDDIEAGCRGLLDWFCAETVTIDFSKCTSREELYSVLRHEMMWKPYYGENLDALWDILTGLPHRGECFRLIPPENAPESVKKYARRIEDVFREAGQLKL